MSQRHTSTLGITIFLSTALAACVTTGSSRAQTAPPTSVTIAGDLQQELGCSEDWQPVCTATQLSFDAEDDVWQGTFEVPAGDWLYKAPLNSSWDENYGAGGVANGDNINLSLSDTEAVKFYYSHATHWVTDNVNSIIATVAGSFQNELGCNEDWQPGCLQSWLQDPDGDGIYVFRTARIPAGNYEAKVALGESWDINYGENGEQNGANITFSIEQAGEIEFAFDIVSNVLSIGGASADPQPDAVTIAGSLQEELGCPGDWQPDCLATGLVFDQTDQVWQREFLVPVGDWQYKAPINLSWDENYGANGQRDGANIDLSLADEQAVKFYYSRQSNWVTDNRNSRIAVAAGDFQSELGCPGDWQPDCLRSWLQDVDGDGIYQLAAALPPGDYQTKAAINESWDESYGVGGGSANIEFTVVPGQTQTYFSFDSASNILTVSDTAVIPRGDLRQAQAYWLDRQTLAWNGGNDEAVFALHGSTSANLTLEEAGVVGGSALMLSVDAQGMSAELQRKFPHLAGMRVLRLDASEDAVRELLLGQLAISASEADGTLLDATGLQIPGVLDDLYAFDGTLGVSFRRGSPTLSLWAPTAQRVRLLLFDDTTPDAQATALAMTRDDRTGVWSITGDRDWNRRFYRFEVTVFAPSTGQIEVNQVTDPYSLSLATNSSHSQIVDLSERSLQPRRWKSLKKRAVNAPEDIVLYELHVRDFSINDPLISESERGTFKAFSNRRSSGMKHLRRLARSGVSHVHLLPVFDIATINERRDEQLMVDEALLSSYPADSSQQQAAVEAIKDADGFNWGYDPFHYTVPEGSYSTNPDGITRIIEFREMVLALHRAGLRVVMDVVYNHTNAAGQNGTSVLDRIVPGYYHRLNGDGQVEMSTCCANTASEHAMMEKLMIDSVLTWAKHYKVDGFRFDLMGHHSKENILKLRQRLDQLSLRRDGIDGRGIYVYGEGWNFGEVANNARFEQATQPNMGGTGIGTFSDRLRDGMRGGNPFSDVRDQGFMNGLVVDPSLFEQDNGDDTLRLLQTTDWIRVGLAGDLAEYRFENYAGQTVAASTIDYLGQAAGYTEDPQENIKYVSAHDNETLFDANQLKLPLATGMDDRVRVQNFGNAVVMWGQGIPFFHAGQEFLRSKSMDRDSFNSGDWFNAIDWSFATDNWGKGLPVAEKNEDKWPLMAPLLADPSLAPSQTDRERAVRYFQALAKVRKTTPLLRLRSGEQVQEAVRFHNTGPNQIPGVIVMTVSGSDDDNDKGGDAEGILVLFNARPDAVQFQLPALAGNEYELHEELEELFDDDRSFYDKVPDEVDAGNFLIPARSALLYQLDD